MAKGMAIKEKCDIIGNKFPEILKEVHLQKKSRQES